MDVKDILRLATNPLITGALGAYLAKEKLGSKYGTVVTMAGGALAGAVAGALVQQFLLPAASPTPPQPVLQGVASAPNTVNLDFSALPARASAPALPAPMATPSTAVPPPEGIFAQTSYALPDDSDGGWGGGN